MTDSTPDRPTRGLYQKYRAYRVFERPPGLSGFARKDMSPVMQRFFLLIPESDPHAIQALLTYADSVRASNPQLSDDILEWMSQYPAPKLEPPLTVQITRTRERVPPTSVSRQYHVPGMQLHGGKAYLRVQGVYVRVHDGVIVEFDEDDNEYYPVDPE